MSLVSYFGEINDLSSRNAVEDSDEEAELKEGQSQPEKSVEPRVNVDPPNFRLPPEVTTIIVAIADFTRSIHCKSLRDTITVLASVTPNPKAFGKLESDATAVKGIKMSIVQSKVDPKTAWIMFNKLSHVTNKSGRLVAVVHEILDTLVPKQAVPNSRLIAISFEKLQSGLHQQGDEPFVYLINQHFDTSAIYKNESFKKLRLLAPGVITSPVAAYAFQYATLHSRAAIALVIPDPQELILRQSAGSPIATLQSLIPSDFRILIEKGSAFLTSHLENNIFT